MNQSLIQLLFALLKSAICGNLLEQKHKQAFSLEILPKLVSICHKHDILHILAYSLSKNGLIDLKQHKNLENQLIKGVYSYEQISFELENIISIFENNQIDFIPLKGAVIKKLYFEPWLRNSCDIDVLVKEQDLEKACQCLINQGYKSNVGTPHDIGFNSKNGQHIELHFKLVESGYAKDSNKILESVWEYANPVKDSKYRYELSDECFYYYHVAHMAKHVEVGGCGIKPFIDLYLLDNIENKNFNKNNKLLELGGLKQFAQSCLALSKCWFDGQDYNQTLMEFEKYILNGGVYGSSKNRVKVDRQRNASKIKYFLSRLFLPYEVIKYQFPILVKRKWLTPFYQVVRWVKIIFGGRYKIAKAEINYSNNLSKEQIQATKNLLNSIGLI